jgi:hypothetical protein
MRRVNKWVGQRDGMDPSADAASLKQIIDQAAIVYGPAFAAPAPDIHRSFLTRLAFSSQPAQMIADLRDLIENQNKKMGENRDQINSEINDAQDNDLRVSP